LAHVVQQRAGRVRNPLGSGIAVVQDHALEAEADRLGQHAAAHRVTAQAKLMPAAVRPSAQVRISAPIGAGPRSYRLTAGAGGRQVGSVMVHARDRGVVEVTDLGVDQSQRGQGIGQMLVASAAKTGLHFGKSKVTLAAQDKGSGHLTRWYKEMGFTQTGVNQRGYPQLEAPISRVLAGTVQRREKPLANPNAARLPETGSCRPSSTQPRSGYREWEGRLLNGQRYSGSPPTATGAVQARWRAASHGMPTPCASGSARQTVRVGGCALRPALVYLSPRRFGSRTVQMAEPPERHDTIYAHTHTKPTSKLTGKPQGPHTFSFAVVNYGFETSNVPDDWDLLTSNFMEQVPKPKEVDKILEVEMPGKLTTRMTQSLKRYREEYKALYTSIEKALKSRRITIKHQLTSGVSWSCTRTRPMPGKQRGQQRIVPQKEKERVTT
jgi:GNAT superfamily N-acetyltransferase